MPVTLTRLEQPTAQDRLDLERLMAEQDDPLLLRAFDDWRRQGGVRLWAGYFNERIVGMVLTRGECIEGLAVRFITQSRGVASRMLELLRQQGRWRAHPALPEPVGEFIRRRRLPVNDG